MNGFNMIDGVFCEYDQSEFCINGELVVYFKSFLGTEFDDNVAEVNTSNKRKELIEFLIKYMQIHLPDFKRPKSLNILYELFQ
jgi:DNA repair protein RecO (recombination protein O)